MRCPAGLLLLVLSPLVSAATEPPVFRWQRDVELPGVTETTAVAVPLDEMIYAATRDGWPDVRLFDPQGRAVAYVIRPASETKSRTDRRFWPAEQTSARVEKEGGLVVELALRKDELQPTGLRIVTPLHDFEHQVRVESSADGATWVSGGPPAVIFDYSQFVDARNDRVPFSAGDHRRFRFHIADVTSEQESQLLQLHRRLRGGKETEQTERTTIARRPFRIDRVEFYRDEILPQATETKLAAYQPARFRQTEDVEKHLSLIDMVAGRQPITRINVETADTNFSRSVEIETEVDGEAGVRKSRASGTLTRFAVGSLHKEELSLKVPEGRWDRCRLAIDNGDSPPLKITGIELAGPLYEVVFLASPGERYRLEHGSPTAEAGKLDTAALDAVLRKEGPPKSSGTLSTPRENLAAPTKGPWRPWNDPNVLISTIVVLTLLLGLGLWRAAGRIKAEETGEGPQSE